ncbi:MAG: hypothetical protein ACM31L_01930 [Actinomycetota bacterium]
MTVQPSPDHAPDDGPDPVRRHRMAGWLVVLFSLGWLGAVGWTQLVEPATELVANHTTPTVQQQMRKCEGSFHQRYDCKQQILLAGERWGMERVLDRMLLVLAPPVSLWLVWGAMRPKAGR